jgi:hypothetical protein
MLLAKTMPDPPNTLLLVLSPFTPSDKEYDPDDTFWAPQASVSE